MIFSPSPANRTSPSWKPRRSPATSCPGVCRVDAPSATSSRNTRRKQDCRLFIPNNRRWARAESEKRSTVTRRKEKHEREFLGSERVLAIANFFCGFPFSRCVRNPKKDCFGATPKPARGTRALTDCPLWSAKELKARTSAGTITCRKMSKLVSSQIPPCASAAKHVKSRAKNGTKCPTTALLGQGILTTTPDGSAHRLGGTSCFSNRTDQRDSKLSVRWAQEKIHFAGFSFRTSASTARKQAASKRVHPVQSVGL